MTTLTLELETHVFNHLKETSDKKGVSIQEYVKGVIHDEISSYKVSQEFESMAQDIVQEDLELLKRLA